MPKKWGLLILLAILVLSLSVMTYQSNRQHLLPLKSLHAVLDRLHEAKTSVKEALSAPFRRMMIREKENIRLRAEIDRLRQHGEACREAIQENRNLRALLALKDHDPRYVTAARIIGRGSDFWSKTVVLDKGSSDGIQKDMIAITERGVAGKISDAHSSYSHLLLIGDINFSAAARLQESRTEGILSGTGFRRCVLKYIPHEDTVREGEVLITSGLDTLFPQGIPLGYVSKVDKKEAGFFQDIEVIPFVEDTRLEIVAIISKE